VNDSSNSVRMRIVNDNQAGHLIIDDRRAGRISGPLRMFPEDSHISSPDNS